MHLAAHLVLVVWATVLLAPRAADAVLISLGDGTGNSNPAVVTAARHVGPMTGGSGTYLGEGWVLTANHVGPGDIVLEGVVSQYVPETAIRLETSPGMYADLLMFQIYPAPPLDKIDIRTTAPPIGEPVLMVGHGSDRGAPITFDPYGPGVPPDEQSGWDWAPTSSLRWGLNNVESISPVPILGTTVFMTRFDEVGGMPYEGQAANGDSGGGVFTYDPAKGAELAGIMISVSLEFGQDSTSTIFTNETIIASIDVYADQIEQNIANAPEPNGGLLAGLLALGLACRRRSRADG